MYRIAVDAMGGDHAPSEVVEGVVRAVSDIPADFEVILAGPTDVVQKELDRLGYTGNRISIVEAPTLVSMDESPTEVLKSKKDSGLVTCVTLQKTGQADASMSAGNSGAMMAACLMILGRAGEISRPAIACNLPSLKKHVVVLDCGANVDEKPKTLQEFAIYGSIYAEHVMQYKNPKVGLLSMGEEEKKGPEVIQETHKLLKQSPINFIGNVEGGDIVMGDCDVIVTSGYTGNVILKLMEGFFELHSKTFGLIDTEAGRKFQAEWNYSNIGAALLLGINGTGLITHGRADAQAIKSGIMRAYEMASHKISDRIKSKLTEIH